MATAGTSLESQSDLYIPLRSRVFILHRDNEQSAENGTSEARYRREFHRRLEECDRLIKDLRRSAERLRISVPETEHRIHDLTITLQEVAAEASHSVCDLRELLASNDGESRTHQA